MKDKKYIERIIAYCNKIARYLDGVSNIEAFESNEEKVDAVLLNLEQIGETAKKLSDDIKHNTTTIEWNKIIGLRNLISHEYEGVDLTLIFNVARISIPDLLSKLVKIKI
ncbi:Protein of uncharacterised function DUF86 [Acholeplasma oculi]|uniref:DUF86 domain-containing protein n=1 Tax=Acholeplasma oculi TaxID=35623 RepID=A0A061A9R7_9MOLU|nr:HepT-like ribonuclease domain-containing protein [Acholeplasma oculi]CDR30613.1 hypothetical protein, DUF86 [Acholeplasma oculi]SKC46355.1 Uncharacterized conserved protein, contains HEPN domain [Acholeplasma oculi]SUT89339.1 Protein of uncharacterised function DUF86 [Acholeplasma oculi]